MATMIRTTNPLYEPSKHRYIGWFNHTDERYCDAYKTGGYFFTAEERAEHEDQFHSFPSPIDFVDASWNPKEKELVVVRLMKSAQEDARSIFLTQAQCRLCGEDIGDNGQRVSDIQPDAFIFPSGFVHYVEAHNVKPDQEFIDRLLAYSDRR